MFSKLLLTEFDQKVRIIFLGILITNISTFMLMPFLTLYMNYELQFSASLIGIVLTVLLLSQRGFTFVGGILSDKFGLRRIMLIGLFFRSSGYLAFLFSYSFPSLVASSILVGGGGALLSPGLKASIAQLASANRAQAFAVRGMVVNFGATLGPLIGAVIYEVSFSLIFIITVITHIFFFFLIVYFIPNIEKNENNESFIKQVRYIISDKSLIFFTLLISGFWYLYTQLRLTLPLYVEDYFSRGYLIGGIYALNGILVILFQYKTINYLIDKFKRQHILIFGMTLMTFSFLILPILISPLTLVVFSLIFTFGAICIIPIIDDITSFMASEKSLAAYLGFVSFGWAIGGSIGNLSGGVIYEHFKEQGTFYFTWLIFGLIGLFTTGLLILFNKTIFEKGEQASVNQIKRSENNKSQTSN